MVARRYSNSGDLIYKMKIAFVHNMAMHYRIPFFRRLAELYDVDFLFTHAKKVEGLNGVNYEILRNYFGVALGLILRFLKKDYDVIVNGDWDGIPGIIEMISGFTIAKLQRKPFIIWSENWDWKRPLKTKLPLPLIRVIISHSNACLVPGTKHKEFIVSLGASSDEVFIMPNVSNLIIKEEDYVNKDKLKEKFAIENKKVVLYVGRLVKNKGVDYLIKAFAELINEREDVVLIIIGRGECRDELELLSKNLNIEDSVYFMGYVEDELLPAYYLLCDICVVPSITYGMADPCPLVVNEAMYFEKPVIATDAVGAAFDMIKDGENGFMVPEKDSDALYSAMKKIISDPELEKKMGKESKKIIREGFTYEHMLDGFRKAINHALKEAVK